jgi:predicted cupin superfamily sugar epimerase
MQGCTEKNMRYVQFSANQWKSLILHDDGRGETVALGHDIVAGEQLQVVAPRGVWQGMLLNEGGRFALLGTTVSPGFDFEDFEVGTRDALTREFPQYAAMIERLTRP